jgi:crotonobetainyl-CoA:carnitine CoA-transferase CaiB-like acyl-CoA transferase
MGAMPDRRCEDSGIGVDIAQIGRVSPTGGASCSREVCHLNASNPRTLTLLEGVRVASFTQFYLGPVAAQYLADMGADVIKVEPPGRGAWERSWAPGNAMPGGISVLLLLGSRNVRSLSLDLKRQQGQDVARRLCASVDVVIENFRPGVMERFGLGYEHLHNLNPGLIYASASGYGRDSQFRDLPGQDLLIQAESGLAWISGYDGDLPVVAGAPIIDAHGATLLALGVAGALVRKARTGQGERIEVTMMQAAFDLQAEAVAVYLNGGVLEKPRVPLGSAYTSAPYGVYPTAEGYIALSMSTLRDVIAALGDPGGLTKYKDLPDEGFDLREEIYTALAEVLARKPAAEWVAQLRERGIWCAPVVTYDEMLNNAIVRDVDPIVTMTHPAAGSVKLLRHPIRYGSGVAELRSVAPPVGAHSATILESLGYSRSEVEQLAADSVI